MTLEEILASPTREDVFAFIRDDQQRMFRIDVESDSTIRADLTRNQENMTRFMQATSGYLAAVGPAVQAGILPPNAAVEIFTAFARNFKLGKQAEDALDKLGEEAEAKSKEPPKRRRASRRHRRRSARRGRHHERAKEENAAPDQS
jgi:hypothetical protein